MGNLGVGHCQCEEAAGMVPPLSLSELIDAQTDDLETHAAPSVKARWISKAEVGDDLDRAPGALWSDVDFVRAAVSSDGRYIQYVAEGLRADRQLVLAAVESSGSALQYVPEELLMDPEVVSRAARLAKEGLLMSADCPKRYWLDREVVLSMVGRNGCWLEHVSSDLQADREVVLRAVTQTGNALEYARESMRADKGIVLAAVAGESPRALKFAVGDLRLDRELVTEALAQATRRGSLVWDVRDVPQELWHDHAFVLKTVGYDGTRLKHAACELRSDREVVVTAVRRNPQALRFVEPPLNLDPDVLGAAGLQIEDTGLAAQRTVVLSARLGVRAGIAGSTPRDAAEIPTRMNLEMLKHPVFVHDCTVCSPVPVGQGFCGPPEQALDLSFRCRGCCGVICSQRHNGLACDAQPPCGNGPKATVHSCFRYACRRRLEYAKRSGGMMIQVSEYDVGRGAHKLDACQIIQGEIARELDVKVFSADVAGPIDAEVKVRSLARLVEQWLEADDQDMSEVNIASSRRSC